MKVGLHSGTYVGLWYDGPGLTPLEFLRRGRLLGFDGVELDGRRPHGNPTDLDAGRRRSIRETCAELELDMVALSTYTDFSSPVVEHRACQLLMLREQLRLARELGAPVARVFLAWPGVTIRDGVGTAELTQRRFELLWQECTWLEAWNACKAGLREATRYAEEEGIVLALQNQPPVVRDHHDVLDMIAEVDSPWLRACIDLPDLDRRDPAGIHQAIAECGPLLVHTHVRGDFVRAEDGQVAVIPPRRDGTPLPYPDFVRALKAAGYDGYLCYELAWPALDDSRELQGLEFVDQQARLALDYLRGVIAGVEGQAVASSPSLATTRE